MVQKRVTAYASIQTLAVMITLSFLLLTGCGQHGFTQPTPARQTHNDTTNVTRELIPTAEINTPIPRERTSQPTPAQYTKTMLVQRPTLTTLALTPEITSDESVSEEEFDPTIKREAVSSRAPVACNERIPGSDLLSIVTLEYGISSEYEPDDLVPLAGEVPYSVTLGYPTEVRHIILEPLVAMINDMIDAGLRPQVLSGYRSFAAQAIAWDKWNRLYPDHAHIISVPPGHSEHQLGTVLDFGSPELPDVVGQPGIQFHTYFYKTSEGQWLEQNAHKYGFTMSFTLEAFETTGLYYEPWHFRYVGEEIAAQLHDQALTLTEYWLANEPAPCTP